MSPDWEEGGAILVLLGSVLSWTRSMLICPKETTNWSGMQSSLTLRRKLLSQVSGLLLSPEGASLQTLYRTQKTRMMADIVHGVQPSLFHFVFPFLHHDTTENRQAPTKKRTAK